MAGDYHATTLTATQATGTINLLLNGGALTLSLHQDGTTTGHLFVPGAGEGGADVDLDLPGTWTLTRNTVTFASDADTFIRDMPFTPELNRLRGEETFGDFTIRVVLTSRKSRRRLRPSPASPQPEGNSGWSRQELEKKAGDWEGMAEQRLIRFTSTTT